MPKKENIDKRSVFCGKTAARVLKAERFQKKGFCKIKVIRVLKNKYKIKAKTPCLNEKTSYFCTRNSECALRKTDKYNKSS